MTMFLPYFGQVVWPVPLTKRYILREILRRLDLVVHGFGIMLDDIGLNIGWIDVDVPPSEVGGVRGRKKFYSEECTTRVEAMENACEAAVAWMIRVCHVEVRDLNFEKMKDLEGKVRHMDQLVSMFCDAAEASKENQQATKRCYRALFMQAQCLLKKYSDVVPTDRGPSTRMEQLVCALVTLITKGAAMSDVPMAKVSWSLRCFRI